MRRASLAKLRLQLQRPMSQLNLDGSTCTYFVKMQFGFGLCLCLAALTSSWVSSAKVTSQSPSSPPVPWPIVVPVAELRKARQEIGSSQNYTTEFPYWANRTLLAIGQKFMAKNFHGFVYASALTTVLMGVDTQRVLISGGNTTDPVKATRRYLINVLHFWYWATAGLGSEELFESLNLIHAVHAKVGHSAHQKYKMYEKPFIPTPPRGSNPLKVNTRVWDAFERDMLASPLRVLRDKEIFPPRDGQTVYPLNQFAMATQLYSFMAYTLISPDKMLTPGASEEELWGYLHFWGFIGRGLGIKDEYNVCLQPDFPTAQAYFREIMREYFIPSLLDMTYEHKAVMEVAIKAGEAILGYLEPAIVFHLICEDLLEIKCPNVAKTLPPTSRTASGLLTIGRPAFKSNSFKRGANFAINAMIQRQTFKHFNFNMIFPKNFTGGILDLDNELLRTSDVHWGEKEPSQHL